MANYDLDKTWYGATRLIAKCSWGPSMQDKQLIQTKTAKNLINSILPTNSFDSVTKWANDLESEHSVFDSRHNYVQVSLVQPRVSSPSITSSSPTPQKLTI